MTTRPLKRVIVESPFKPTSDWPGVRWWQRWQNILYARAAVRDSVLRGEAPIASHLLFTQRGVLDDDIAYERRLGIAAGLAWKSVAEAFVVYIDRGISKGMREAIVAATDAKIPVIYRELGRT